jgi:uncharacterized protein (TIGR00725 family)
MQANGGERPSTTLQFLGPERAVSRRPVIGIMGQSEADAVTLDRARRLGELAAEAGWIVLTGGWPAGVMEAACAGAKSVPGSLTIGILPTGPDGPVSPYVDVAVFTGLGEARNAVNALTSDVVVACGAGGPGTASEVALAMKAGRPTVLLAPSAGAAAFFGEIRSKGLLLTADTPEAVISIIEGRLGIPRWPLQSSA